MVKKMAKKLEPNNGGEVIVNMVDGYTVDASRMDDGATELCVIQEVPQGRQTAVVCLTFGSREGLNEFIAMLNTVADNLWPKKGEGDADNQNRNNVADDSPTHNRTGIARCQRDASGAGEATTETGHRLPPSAPG